MKQTNVRRVVLALAVGIWLAALGLMAAAQQVEHGGPQDTLPEEAMPLSGATATPDRLAPPPTVASPNQADEGAQLYWLHCQPCHGDVGQGLTDDWRAQYPPEDQYCWNSGCHGPSPYKQEFQLPTAVPAVIGDGALVKFPTLDSVYRYVSVAMPYFFPGDLTQAEYLAITAHVARGNGLWDGRTLTTENLREYAIPGSLVSLPAATSATATPAPVAPVGGAGVSAIALLLSAGGVVVLIALGGFVLWLRHGRSN
jgi:hypothetical protein